MEKFTEEDIDNCLDDYKIYLVGILNEEYTLKDAQTDLRSLIGTKYDFRVRYCTKGDS